MRLRIAVSCLATVTLVAASASAQTARDRGEGRLVFSDSTFGDSRVVVTDLRSGKGRIVRGTEDADTAAVSADGRLVAFVSSKWTHRRAIWVVRRDGKGSRRFIGDGDYPAWAPSGRRLAFLSYLSNGSAPQLTVVKADGTDSTIVFTGWTNAPTWSPDGKWLAFPTVDGVSGTSDLFVVRSDGGGGHRVAANIERAGDWSPDGRRLVFVGVDENLYTVSAEGGQATRLTDDEGLKSVPRWSSDGSRIAYVEGQTGNVVVLGLSDGRRRVVGHGDSAVWSSGGRLAFVGTTGAMVWRPGETRARLVVRAALGSFFQHLHWLRGGSSLSFIRYVDEAGSSLRTMRDDGTGVHRLTRGLLHGADPAWAPRGGLIAFARVQAPGNRELAVVRPGGQGLRMLTHNRYGWDYQPAWSPAGTRIAFVRASSSSDRALYVVRARGGKPHLLWAGERPNHPAWSPDGRRIAVDGVVRSATPGIRILELSTGRVEQVTHPPDGYDVAPSWSPDGTKLLYTTTIWSRYPADQVRMLSLATGEDREVTPFKYSTNSGPFAARWSPDGSVLAAISTDGGALAAPGIVVTMLPDGSDRRVLWKSDNAYARAVSWAPGG
jgi:Tol biopolymer transport system component